MALDNMSNVSIGVSEAGTDKLVKKIQDKITHVINISTGTQWENWKKVCNDNWEGQGKVIWWNDFVKQINKMNDDLKVLRNQVATDLNDTKNEFIKKDSQVYTAKNK